MKERSVSFQYMYIFRYYIYNIFSTRVASSCVNSGSWSKIYTIYVLYIYYLAHHSGVRRPCLARRIQKLWDNFCMATSRDLRSQMISVGPNHGTSDAIYLL